MTLLYIEQNPGIRAEATGALYLAGIDVITATTLDNALYLLANYEIDVVLIGDVDSVERLIGELCSRHIACAQLSDGVPTDIFSDIPIWRRSNGVRLDLVSKICDLFDTSRGYPKASALQLLHPGDRAVGFRSVMQKV